MSKVDHYDRVDVIAWATSPNVLTLKSVKCCSRDEINEPQLIGLCCDDVMMLGPRVAVMQDVIATALTLIEAVSSTVSSTESLSVPATSFVPLPAAEPFRAPYVTALDSSSSSPMGMTTEHNKGHGTMVANQVCACAVAAICT